MIYDLLPVSVLYCWFTDVYDNSNVLLLHKLCSYSHIKVLVDSSLLKSHINVRTLPYTPLARLANWVWQTYSLNVEFVNQNGVTAQTSSNPKTQYIESISWIPTSTLICLMLTPMHSIQVATLETGILWPLPLNGLEPCMSKNGDL